MSPTEWLTEGWRESEQFILDWMEAWMSSVLNDEDNWSTTISKKKIFLLWEGFHSDP